MRVRAHDVSLPTAADHLKAMGGGLQVYHSLAGHQEGSGWFGNAVRWASPILQNAARAGASSFLKHSKDGDYKGALKRAGMDSLNAAKTGAQRRLAAGDRPF